MRISKRIQEIEQLIPQNCILADIGCDHAYLDVLAIQHGKCKKTYACDVAKGPLENAKRVINENHLNNIVIPILSCGLENVPSDANVCVIAGMGFETMKSILENKKLQQFHTLILQSNSDVMELRKWLIANHWIITQEKMIHEGHFYVILVCEKGTDTYTEEDYLFGKSGHDEVFHDYLLFRKNRIESIINQLKDPSSIQEFKHLLELIDKKMKQF